MMKRSFGLRDVLFLAALLVTGLLLTVGIFRFSESGSQIRVTVDGQLYGVYPLDENRCVQVTLADGGSNQIRIADGTAYMEQADCPDGLCMRQGAISRTGQTIVCLPHRLVVEVYGAQTNEYDTVSQ